MVYQCGTRVVHQVRKNVPNEVKGREQREIMTIDDLLQLSDRHKKNTAAWRGGEAYLFGMTHILTSQLDFAHGRASACVNKSGETKGRGTHSTGIRRNGGE